MHISYWVILAVSLLEVVLLAGVVVFFLRLRKSEQLLAKLQQNQREFLARIDQNVDLEQQILANFSARQTELLQLDSRLAEREKQVRALLQQAEGLSRSPQFLRQVIITGHRKGSSVTSLAQSTGLSTEEVELILEQGRSS
ncbi:hypothetical protein SAMN05660653_03061 [Desulfonatronum thiosulfatophilum]|uniref:DUF2802 domain-containing protein n=1 Tax=Desulfonatronum thiosulfatophilum TaxID=617002 RepID=A0A1G6EQQ0_9BACT|nr:hypothetical protein [Desulfonatronum thiosulfatophilum]SDB59889.1 hypothetical protein SAMN05660653_03061 [Desulfonatronum thiosulfatophilum]